MSHVRIRIGVGGVFVGSSSISSSVVICIVVVAGIVPSSTVLTKDIAHSWLLTLIVVTASIHGG